MYFCIMTSTMGQKSLKVSRFTFLAVSSTVRKKETILVISSCKNLLLGEIVCSKVTCRILLAKHRYGKESAINILSNNASSTFIT